MELLPAGSPLPPVPPPPASLGHAGHVQPQRTRPPCTWLHFYFRGQSWIRNCSKSVLLIGMMGQSVPLTNFQVPPNWDEWLQGHAEVQRDLFKLEKWADRSLMKFNKDKCEVLYLGRNNSTHQDVQGGGYVDRKQLSRKRPEIPGGHQVEHDPAACHCAKDSKLNPGLH